MKLHFVFFLIFFLKFTFQCSFITHFYITEHSISDAQNTLDPKFYTLLTNNLITSQVGSMSPDWGYLGDDYHHDLAEIMHGSEYLYASFDYLKEKYPNINDEESQKHWAFFVGIGCHQVADIYWHGLNGDPLGFMKEANRKDIDRLNISWITDVIIEPAVDMFIVDKYHPQISFKWWIPAQDVCDVYSVLGATVEPDDFILGIDVLKVLMILMKTLNWAGTELGKVILEWSYANYMTWPHGGVQNCIDMSVPYYTDAWLYLNDNKLFPQNFSPYFSPFFDNFFSFNDITDNFFQNLIPAARELIDSGIITISHTQNDDGSVTSENPHIADFSKFLGLIQRYFGINTLEHLSYQFLNEFL
ncbi:hypothetical protein M0811_13818 [Anaeramoeba ignava]|uniref:Phospholipase C/D domain-containing protein n=1 Tax=Anaeramoeba ignava TaxID=1746090 RepID=A0A9Q0LXS6_ANAIG|nr:hypothetical protein M0811_13818 [Anaeramoeba ignava]